MAPSQCHAPAARTCTAAALATALLSSSVGAQALETSKVRQLYEAAKKEGQVVIWGTQRREVEWIPAAFGKFFPGTHGSGLIRLNDDTAPAFPVTVGPGQDTIQCPFEAIPPGKPNNANRSAPFNIVGSAAAVMIHEIPETNPQFAYLEARNPPVSWPYPDAASGGWCLDAP